MSFLWLWNWLQNSHHSLSHWESPTQAPQLSPSSAEHYWESRREDGAKVAPYQWERHYPPELTPGSHEEKSHPLAGSPPAKERRPDQGLCEGTELLLEEMEMTGPHYLSPEKPACKSRGNSRTSHGTTGANSGKGGCQGWILSLCLFNLHAEMSDWIDHMLESRLPGEITTSDMQMIPL